MNNRVPRTPFSTPLSGSAKEAELRLKNIFSGPKKRPPALFLALMFSVCLLCGNLVSCQMAEAEMPEGSTSIAPDSSASVPMDEHPSVSGGQEWLTAELGNFITRECLLDEPYQWLTPEEAAVLENLPVDELPKEAVQLYGMVIRVEDYWQGILLPIAFDPTYDVTVYGVVGGMPSDAAPLTSPMLWGSDLRQDGIVLRYGNQTSYFPLEWTDSAKHNKNPELLVDDLDGDGQPEAALSLLWGSGTGAWSEALYIFDLDAMTYTTPDYSEIPLEITYDSDLDRARMTSGDKEWPVRLDDLGLSFEGEVEVGNIVEFSVEDEQMLCKLTPDFTCSTTGYVAFVQFPVVYENGVYKLGPAVHMGDIL